MHCRLQLYYKCIRKLKFLFQSKIEVPLACFLRKWVAGRAHGGEIRSPLLRAGPEPFRWWCAGRCAAAESAEKPKGGRAAPRCFAQAVGSCTSPVDYGDLYPPVEEPVATADPKASKKKDKDKEKKFVWNHGITLPLKNVRKRRFRKTAKKKYIESPDVEKEVKRLLSTDAEAVSTRWEIIAEDETKETENQGLDISSPGMSGHRQGHDSLEHDELREIFNDLSSSSEDEEDVNIIDTEEDLERQLQDKLNESDEQHQENEGTNQLVMGIQKQIDNVKGKLQETQDRAKRQEDLIRKVENLALKNRFQAVLDELKQKEDREKEQLSSLQEELESLLEK
uniref:transcription initiation factor TFIID subunit 7-like n=1 Tax=Myodes glareolus TaxID=447135 RepID=UPI0020215730|nr:transcription initiation factor TFIID subunit 7-like [Myodes glareolus]